MTAVKIATDAEGECLRLEAALAIEQSASGRLQRAVAVLADQVAAGNNVIRQLQASIDEQAGHVVRIVELEAALRVHLAVAAEDPVLVTPIERRVIELEAELAADTATAVAIAEQREKLLRVACAGLNAITQLICESRGVAGLHRNGDLATWTELGTGGRFEEWLLDFDTAVIALDAAGITPLAPEPPPAEGGR